MKRFVLGLLLIASPALAGVDRVEKARQEAQEARDEIFASKEVQEYCERNPTPETPYIAIYKGMEVNIDCGLRNEYVALKRKENPNWPKQS